MIIESNEPAIQASEMYKGKEIRTVKWPVSGEVSYYIGSNYGVKYDSISEVRARIDEINVMPEIEINLDGMFGARK